mmetsp:Transcript_36386/g.102786  ORF Transcript_36386/g.102786 Transcript_36386/m.102786 type:complete len:364 (-) Transcript_36386:111-1202(-)
MASHVASRPRSTISWTPASRSPYTSRVAHRLGVPQTGSDIISTPRGRARAWPRRASVAKTEQSTSLGSNNWNNFASRVSGEWEGSTSSFSQDGSVKSLPENYVPGAYKDWGVEVVDWTHMSSAIASETGLVTSVKRFMPVVGCEADAVAYVEDSTESLRSEEGLKWEAKTITEEGSYSIGPRILAQEGDALMKHRIEACLAGPDGWRVRMVYDLQRKDAMSPWKVLNLDVFKEEYVGEYEGGTDLRACGGAVGWGDKPRTEVADVTSDDWKFVSGAAYTCRGEDLAFVECEVPERTTRSETVGLVCLPLRMWSRVMIDDGDVLLESGWICSQDAQVIVSREYEDNKLTTVTIRTEGREQSEVP